MKLINKNQKHASSHALVLYDIPKLNDSDEGIRAFAISHSSGNLVSADNTGLIKIWNAHKQLIREIQFPEPANSLCFIDYREDLMIGHG